MKRIGLLTYFRDTNPGTFLQAFAMQQALKERFPRDHVEVIDFSYTKRMFPESKDLTMLARWRSIWERLQVGLERIRKYQMTRRNFLVLSKGNLVTDQTFRALKFIEDGSYDLIVVGSDTVLEMPKARCANDEPSVYWLAKKMNSVKVACAASVGATRLGNISTTLKDRMATAIRDFRLVGVRDSMTWDMMAALGVPADRLYRVPDPTFALTIDEAPFRRVLDENQIDLSRPSMGIDLPENLPLCRELIHLYRSKGFTIISPRYNRYADYSLALSPFEWAGMFKYVALFITSTFHGTIFSLKNGTPVFTIEYDPVRFDKNHCSKVRDLLEQLNLEETNHLNLMGFGDDSAVIRRIEHAVATWNADPVKQQVAEMASSVHRFLGQVLRD